MSKNIYRGLNQPEHNPNRNGFDRSQKHVFSANVGQLIPLSPIETIPHSHYKIDVSSLVRTLPLNAAAFMRCKIHFDVYFVPYTQLYHNFNAFVGQSTDVNSAAMKHVAAYAPNFPLYAFVNYLNQVSQLDIMGYNKTFGISRIMDMLGYGRYKKGFNYDMSTINEVYPNIFRALAYQKIWFDYYRNPYYDNASLTPGNTYQECFNVDDIQTADMHITSMPRLVNIFTQRYVQWKKDLFMGVLPSTQFGSVTSVLPSNLVLQNNLSSISSLSHTAVSPSNKQLYAVDSNDNVITGSNSWNIAGLSSLGTTNTNVLDLRRNLAIQKWKEYRLRAGNRQDNIQKAFFGVKPKFMMDEHPEFLGSFEKDLDINEVISTTNNGPYVSEQSAPLGTIAGKGIAVVNDREINFSCNDFGIIMPVCYIRPESEYESFGLDKSNQLIEPTDFYNPSYENLGLEAVTAGQLKANVWPNNMNVVMGYAPRYYCYKTGIDKVHNHFNGAFNVPGGSVSTDGELNYWVPTRKDLTANLQLSLAQIYINPNILDNIFINQVQNGSDAEDAFLLNTYVRCHCVQPMSKLGLPSL